MSEVHNPKSENWCLKSTIGSLMYEVRQNLKFDVRRLSENCLNYVQSLKYYVCLFKTWSPKTKVWSPKNVQNPCLKPKSEVYQLSKSETESNAQNLKLEVESLKSKVYLNSVQSFLQLL